MSDHGLFSSYKGHQGAANGQGSWGVFQGYAQGFERLDAGSRAGFSSSTPPPPWTSVFQRILNKKELLLHTQTFLLIMSALRLVIALETLNEPYEKYTVAFFD